MKSNQYLTLGALALVLPLVVSCGNGNNQVVDMAPQSMCFMNPMKPVEIINACTDAVAIDKPAALSKFQPGATLMPLP